MLASQLLLPEGPLGLEGKPPGEEVQALASLGYLAPLGAGRVLLPLMMRVLHRTGTTIRQQMNRLGAFEVCLPQGAELDTLGGLRPAPLLVYEVGQRFSACAFDEDSAAERLLGEACVRLQRRCAITTLPFSVQRDKGRASCSVSLLDLIEAAVRITGDGLCWPVAIAPFFVTVLPKGAGHVEAARRLYEDLQVRGVEALLCDRPGSERDDAGRSGAPLRVIVDGGGGTVVRCDGTNEGVMAAPHIASLIQREVERSLEGC